METEPLKPKLEKAQRALEVALEEACGADLSKVDTGELIRIEETLSAASNAAKDAVSVRLRMRSRRAAGPKQPEQPGGGPGDAPATAAPVPDDAVIARRVFDDLRGQRWNVFAIHTSQTATERANLPEAYRTGWLVFESAAELRRVAPIPENWQDLPMDELRLLCHQAVSAPRRKGARPTTPTPDTAKGKEAD